jgi:hypothetical protein
LIGPSPSLQDGLDGDVDLPPRADLLIADPVVARIGVSVVVLVGLDRDGDAVRERVAPHGIV